MDNYRFEVALSFAGDDKRDKLRDIAQILQSVLENVLGKGKVFFDEWFEAEIAGSDANLYLQDIYRRHSRLVVSCICERYDEKQWTKWEWRAIQDLEAALGDDERLRFLPIRFGDGDVAGLFSSAIVPDVRARPSEKVAELILTRLELARGKPGEFLPHLGSVTRKALTQSSHLDPPEPPAQILLATPTRALVAHRERLRSELQTLGLQVVDAPPPPSELEAHDRVLQESLSNSKLTVHLMDDGDGLLSDSLDDPLLCTRQWDAIRQRQVPSVLWIPKKVELEQEKRTPELDYLSQLERQPRVGRNNYRVCRSPSIKELAQEVQTAVAAMQASNPLPKREVLLDSHLSDQSVAYGLALKLVKRNIQPYLTFNQETPGASLQEFEEKLRMANLLVVIFGASEPTRVVERIKLTYRRLAERGDFDKRLVLLLAQPAKSDDAIQLPPMFSVERVNNSLAEEITDPNVDKIITLAGGD